jgi:hypothetical protein
MRVGVRENRMSILDKHTRINIQKMKSEVGYSYVTIKVTRSRINKGLLAIPVSLLDRFPKEKRKIAIFFDDEERASIKSFVPYNSSSQECRINGLASWFVKNKIQNQDEIVIQFLDENEGVYRLIKEIKFIEQIKALEDDILRIKKDEDLEKCFEDLALKVNQSKKEVAIVEFLRLNNEVMKKRAYKKSNTSLVRENVPVSLRKILELIYQGKCQVSNFTFIQRNGKPYFEIHHIKHDYGNHFRNLLVVSPNIHAMFTHANYAEYFDNDGWLRKVKFNDKEFNVYQAVDNLITL